MLTDWTECKGHQIRVKPKWQLTPEITDFVVECLRGLAANFASEDDWGMVDETMKDLGRVWYGPVNSRKKIIEGLLWSWATDFPAGFKRYSVVRQVIDIREISRRRVG
jgi:hypothetical protein